MTDINEKSSGADIEGPGIQLRRARERRGLLLHDVAQELHLDEWMLQALEEDDFSALGAPVFAKGHMRKYGDMLGLDSDDLMIAYYRKRGRDDSPPPITTMMAPESPRRAIQWRRFGLPLAVLAVAVILIFLVLSFLSRTQPVPPATPSSSAVSSQDLPGDQVVLTPADSLRERMQDSSDAMTIELPEQASGAASNESVDAPSSEGVPAGAPAAVDDSSGRTGDAAAGLADSAAQAEPANTPAAMTPAIDAAIAPVQLRLILTGESWVEVTDSDGNRLIYAILSAGRRRTVSGNPPIEVFLGLNSVVQVEVNGQPFEIPRSAIRGNTARFVIDPDLR